MKQLLKHLMTWAIILTTAFVHAQSFTVVESEMNVNGTSSLHDWTSSVTQVQATGNISIENGDIKDISGVKVTIPVVSIKSTKGSVMDNKTWDAFDYEKNPNIKFKMTDLLRIDEESYGYTMAVKGDLTMAGKTRSITLQLECSKVGTHVYEFSGLHSMKMTNYDMTPPTALFGTIKVGDDISVDFKIKIQVSN